MYEIIIFIMIIILIVCNKNTIENFTGKCDINEQRFKLIEEKIALEKKIQPVVVNNHLCEERQDKVSSQSPQPIVIKQNENINDIQNMIQKEKIENQKKLDEINKKIDELTKIEKEEEKSEKEDDDELDVYEIISDIKNDISMPKVSNDLLNNVMLITAVIIGFLLLYFLIVFIMNILRRKSKEIKLIDLSYEDAIKAVKEKALRKKYGLTDNIFK